MQVQKKSWAAVVSMAFLAACTQAPSWNGGSAPASGSGTAAEPVTSINGQPVSINCGAGKQALVRQVSFEGRTASQVDCVDTRRLAASSDVITIEDELEVPQPAPAPVRRTVARTEPARERVVERVVYRDAPRDEPAPKPRARRTRPGEQSALIIAGSTAAGAGAGAAIGGKKGALIGAVIGGVGGTIYDRTTRKK